MQKQVLPNADAGGEAAARGWGSWRGGLKGNIFEDYVKVCLVIYVSVLVGK